MSYHGVEIIETGPGTATVKSRSAATTMVIGTAPIGDVHDTQAKRANYINQPILITTRAEAAAAFGQHKDGFTIPAVLDAIFDQAQTSGVGQIEVVNVFDPDTHSAPSDVDAADIIGTVSASGKLSGLKCAYSSYHRLGRFPKFLVAPGFTGLSGVRAELEVICNKIRARSILDTPAGVSAQQVIEARGPSGSFNLQYNSRRLVPVWPHMKVVREGQSAPVLDYYSSRFLGVWLRTIMENGHHHSPSNRPIFGIEDAEVDVLSIPGAKDTDVQKLRNVGVVTVEESFGKGPHTSGNRSSAWPTDTDLRNFLHVQLIEDVLDEEVLHFLEQFRDRLANPARLEYIEDALNQHLQSLTLGDDPVLYYVSFRFDRTRTTANSIAQGQVYWKLIYTPVGVMERLTVDRNIDLAAASNPLALAA